MKSFFIVLYLAWGSIGFLVALNYGSIAHATWRKQGGHWARVAWELLAVPRWLISETALDLYELVRFKRLRPARPAPVGYDAGHLLRFFVALSFVCSAIFGLVFWSIDRGAWPLWLIVINIAAVGTALIAGLGHLFLAWRMRPRPWRLLVLSVVAFIVIGSIL